MIYPVHIKCCLLSMHCWVSGPNTKTNSQYLLNISFRTTAEQYNLCKKMSQMLLNPTIPKFTWSEHKSALTKAELIFLSDSSEKLELANTRPLTVIPIMHAYIRLQCCFDENITSHNEWKWMYVCGIKIAHNYTITPDDTGMPSSNTTNIKDSPANISLRLVCKQIKFIKEGWLEVNTNMPYVLPVVYIGNEFSLLR